MTSADLQAVRSSHPAQEQTMSMGNSPADRAIASSTPSGSWPKLTPTGQHAWRDTNRSSGACSNACGRTGSNRSATRRPSLQIRRFRCGHSIPVQISPLPWACRCPLFTSVRRTTTSFIRAAPIGRAPPRSSPRHHHRALPVARPRLALPDPSPEPDCCRTPGRTGSVKVGFACT